MVEVDRGRFVAEQFKRFIVMAIHVPCEEVEHRHVSQVGQPASSVVRRRLFDQLAVIRIDLPRGLSSPVVRSAQTNQQYMGSIRNPTSDER